VTLTLASPEATAALGAALGAACRGGEVIRVSGPLGAGKTVLAKGVARGLGIDPHGVTSPTFTLLSIHRGRLPFYHVDLYRVAGPEEIAHLELFDEVEGPGVTFVEWPERAESRLPPGGLMVDIRDTGDGGREAIVTSADPDHAHLLQAAEGFARAA
jgi:tRNA threonylcarbamoyladenosine biosynthesis protein TsaE